MHNLLSAFIQQIFFSSSTSEVKGSRTSWCHVSINISEVECLVCSVDMLRMKSLPDLASGKDLASGQTNRFTHVFLPSAVV